MSSEWREQAACLGLDTDTFFPPQGTDSTPAQLICADCPVQVECLAYALSRCIRYGVWGGLTWRERCTLRRNLRRKGWRTSQLANLGRVEAEALLLPHLGGGSGDP